MGQAIRPEHETLPARAKHLGLSPSRLRSEPRKAGRDRSRELLRVAMTAERAMTLDLADALAIAERCARRAVEGASPIDLGDVLALAEHGPGGLRFARRILAGLSVELDRIAASDR